MTRRMSRRKGSVADELILDHLILTNWQREEFKAEGQLHQVAIIKPKTSSRQLQLSQGRIRSK